MAIIVLSIDGVAPRYVTPDTMPGLLALGRQGGACYRARTVDPSLTLPAHLSMLRGVGPYDHGITENEPEAKLPADCAPSFLDLCRQSGLTTAAITSWRPLQPAFGRGATTYNLLFDDGYNPEIDAVVTDTTVDLLSGNRLPEVTFVYLISPDLAGHDHGWGSSEYRAALAASDRRLQQIVRCLDVAHDTIVVTTDHGGSARHHVSGSIDDVETFVVVRSPSVRAGSTWPEASILDIAPTVAHACGLAADGRWTGRSLLGRQRSTVDYLIELVKRQEQFSYGERVTMAQHALQSAARAHAEGAPDELVVAALLHDVGHLFGEAGRWGFPDHAVAGARALQGLLPPQTTEPIRLHVDAKRWLVSNRVGYAEHLSEASTASLNQQGGPFDAAQSRAFDSEPFAGDAIALRQWDDDGKSPGSGTHDVDFFRPIIGRVVGTDADAEVDAPDPMWVRDACRCEHCRDPISDQHLIDATELGRWRQAVITAEERHRSTVTVVLTMADGSDTHRCLISSERWSARKASGPLTLRDTASVRISWERDSPEITDLSPLRADSPRWTNELCRRLVTYGVALVHHLPTTPETVLDVAASIGFVRTTNYGSLFDVRNEPEPENLAYSTVGLPLHTDNPYRRPCPTVQLLHCLKPAKVGGETILVDGLRAAERLLADYPHEFDLLTSVPVTFRFHTRSAGQDPSSDDVDLRAMRTIIELAADGSIAAVNLNHRSMEAPHSELAHDFYPAYLRFCDIVNDKSLALRMKLEAGDLIAFDNRRVLHARTGFTTDADRHLQGCYIDMDAVRSTALTTRLEAAPLEP